MDESEEHTRVTAADLMGTDDLGGGNMITSAIIVCTAVDMETGVENVYVIEDDFTPVWKLFGLLSFAKDTFLESKQEYEEDEAE